MPKLRNHQIMSPLKEFEQRLEEEIKRLEEAERQLKEAESGPSSFPPPHKIFEGDLDELTR